MVTGSDGAGRSCVLLDDGGFRQGGNVEVWSTDPRARDRFGGGPVQLLPPKGGSNVRYVVIAPESAEAGLTEPERREEARAFFAGMGAPDVLVPGVGHPHAHRTETLDYIVVLAGELALRLEDGERALRPGDIVVQRGTAHAWINRGATPAIFVSVMIDAARGDDPLA